MDVFSWAFWASLGAFALVQLFVFRTSAQGRRRPGSDGAGDGVGERAQEFPAVRQGYLPAYKRHPMRRFSNLSEEPYLRTQWRDEGKVEASTWNSSPRPSLDRERRAS